MSILLEHVTKGFQDQAVLTDLSLEIQPGELFVLLGASGSGKSTLLRIIAGLTTLDSGRVLLHDRDVTELPPQQRDIGFVFQNYSLFQHMSVAANVGFALDVRHIGRAERDRRIVELLDLIGMSEYADRLPSELSGGQQQRVAVARALAHEPNVLLLDEPFGALDTKIRVELRRSLRAIQRRLGVTAILVTHDQDEAFELADRIGIIERGRLLEIGTPDELYRAPRHHYTAAFLGSANLVRAERRENGIYVGETRIADGTETAAISAERDGTVDVVLRPESIRFGPTAESLRLRGAYPLGVGIVQEIAFAVPLPRVIVDWSDSKGAVQKIVALADAESLAREGIQPGRRVWLGFGQFSRLDGASSG